jgi:hypothetical protein
MFSSKRSILYCSEGNTRNISVLARLCPPGNDSTGSSTGLPQQQEAGAEQQGSAQQQQQQDEEQDEAAQQHRDFLLGRCEQAARHLINDRVVELHAKLLKAQEQQQQQQQGVPARMRYLMGLVQKRFGGLDKVAAVKAALQMCSTEGVWMLSSLLAALQTHAARVVRACVLCEVGSLGCMRSATAA